MLKNTLFLFMLLALVSAGALAEEPYIPSLPLNPYFQQAQLPAAAALTAGVNVEVTCLSAPSYDQPGRWTAKASGGDGTYWYQFFIMDAVSWDTHGFRSFSSDPSFQYDFIVPGKYALYVQAIDASGTLGFTIVEFTLADDGRTTVADKVDELVAACTAAGCRTDYDKALWFHDWLINNAYYDLTYTYYSADSILLRGTGVCDGYSKAYELLLRAVGIPTERCIGGDHSWNYVQLDGEWYHVDLTWDDPTDGSTLPVSGYEQHFYFGLPDFILSQDHTYDPLYACTALTHNYFIHSGKVSMWTDGFIEPIQTAIQGKEAKIALDIPPYYRIEMEGMGSKGSEHLVYGIASYALSRMDWPYGSFTLALDAHYDADNRQVSAEVDLSRHTLTLPGSLKTIAAQAFKADASILAVKLPSGLQSVKANAFADCVNLWQITVPDSVTAFSSTALYGCGTVHVYCSEGSAAEGFDYGGNAVIHIQ